MARPGNPVAVNRAEIEALLGSAVLGDLYRALYLIQRAGPAPAHLALPLLTHPDDGLRARAIAVVGIDESRGRRRFPGFEVEDED